MSSWSRIKRQARCAFGHPIWQGEWALFGCPPFVLCARHAEDKYGLLPPSVPRLARQDGDDVKMRQAGEVE